MRKLLYTVVVMLLLVLVAAIVFTQTQLAAPFYHAQPGAEKITQAMVSTPVPAVALPVTVPVPALNPLGTQSSPIMVKLVASPESETQNTEREKDREIQRGIARSMARIAATSLAQNFLMIFQSIIYFLTLAILLMLMDRMKKFADAASRSAEAARKSADAAEALAQRK